MRFVTKRGSRVEAYTACTLLSMSDELFDPVDGPDEDALSKDEQESELQRYRRACEEEFNLKEGDVSNLTASEIREKTRDILTKAVPSAVGTLTYLAKHAKNESIRLKAATTIVERALGRDNAGLVGDPFEEMVRELNK